MELGNSVVSFDFTFIFDTHQETIYEKISRKSKNEKKKLNWKLTELKRKITFPKKAPVTRIYAREDTLKNIKIKNNNKKWTTIMITIRNVILL